MSLRTESSASRQFTSCSILHSFCQLVYALVLNFPEFMTSVILIFGKCVRSFSNSNLASEGQPMEVCFFNKEWKESVDLVLKAMKCSQLPHFTLVTIKECF